MRNYLLRAMVSVACTLSASRTFAQLPSAREVIKRHVDAVGGAEALARVTSRYIWAGYEIPARHVRGSVEVFAARPNKRVIKLAYPEIGAEVTGFDGTRGWTVAASGTAKPVVGAQLFELRDQSVFDFDSHADSLFRAIETVEETEFDGRTCYRLRLISITQREWSEYYDRATGLFAGSFAPHDTEKGRVTVKTVVRDYAVFNGVRLPTRITLSTAGVDEVIRVRTVKTNTVSSSEFELPRSLRAGAAN
jgi:hypothetical protein